LNQNLNNEVEQEEAEVINQVIDFNSPIVVDVRTPEEFITGAYPDAINIPLDELMQRFEELGNNGAREITVYCASGARSAYAQRTLMQIGYENVKNGGGLASMMARKNAKPTTTTAPSTASSNEPLIVDVRSGQEFASGAYPGAINIPLDELQKHINLLGNHSREITLYCASGVRSAYGQRVLQQLGFTNIKNGGGIMQMMSRR